MKRKMRRIIVLTVMFLLIVISSPCSVHSVQSVPGSPAVPAGQEQQEKQKQEETVLDLNRLYLEGQFSVIVEQLGKRDIQQLTLAEQLFYLESQARTSAGKQAEEKLKPLLDAHPQEPAVLSTAAAVYLSLGQLETAQTYLDRAVAIEPGIPGALVTRVLLLLYRRKFEEAAKIYERLAGLDKEWGESELVFLVGIDVYRALGDAEKLTALYKAHAPRVKKINQRYYDSLRADARMYKRMGKNRLFSVEEATGSAVIPFTAENQDLRVNTVAIVIKGKTFKVLLDTGNAAGWLVHSRELNELLKPQTGGRTIARIGAESGMLDGNHQYYETVDFNVFKLRHVVGIYVPKPHPGYPDANLNPSFIRDRVVTLDFVGRRLLVHGKGEFEKGVSVLPEGSFSRLPWLGYKFPYIPIEIKGNSNEIKEQSSIKSFSGVEGAVLQKSPLADGVKNTKERNSKPGLAMVETGAEDIALKLDFVQGMGLEMEPKVKYLANGQVFNYHHAGVEVMVGVFLFRRQAAEVWPLNRFYNRLTGLSPDVMLGPRVFAGAFMVSFDPFDKSIVIIKVR